MIQDRVMTSQEQLIAQRAMSEIARAEGLAERFAETLEALEAEEDVFSPDVTVDLNMPVRRFVLRGPEALMTHIKRIAEGNVRIDVLRTVPTISGFVTEHEQHQEVDGRELTTRRLWLCEVRGGRIVEAVCYCAGGLTSE